MKDPAWRAGRPGAAFYLVVFACLAALGVWRLAVVKVAAAGAGARPLMIDFSDLIELVAAFYVVATLLKCLDYLFAPGGSHPAPGAATAGPAPRVAVVYLCCDDLDEEALRSLCRLRHAGDLEIVLHDDSRGDPRPLEQRVRGIAAAEGRRLTLLRRPRREGGKPGAVNYVLGEIQDRCDFILFCDNDSIALDPGAIEGGLRHFDDPAVAAVQFRGKGVCDPAAGALARRLARAIDIFDIFARHQDRHGMMPFLGHNALVRTRCLVEAGGLTPGVLSDDIDISVRWYLSGLRVAYAREVPFAERAPASYASFRLRARKWAYGCAQVIRRRAADVLFSRRLTLAQRLGFLEFVGFYAVQVLLIGYLIDTYILVPLFWPGAGAGAATGVAGQVGGALVMSAIVMPTFVFCLKERCLAEWPALAWTCCLIYGSTAFETCRGILGALASRRLEWIPTNARIQDESLPRRCWAEFAFGVALFAVPLARTPSLLAMPVSYLFVANYLFSPLILATYGEHARRERRLPVPRRVTLSIVIAGILLTLVAACAAADDILAAEVRVEGDQVQVDGRPFQLRGIHYSPWLPGTGPGKGYPWPAADVVDRDLDMIHSLHANTILVYDDAPVDLFDQAQRHSLLVLQAFNIDWQRFRDEAYLTQRTREILRRVEEARDKPALLGWVVGNEVKEWVRDQVGAGPLASRLGALIAEVRRADPAHPITHANWPVTKDLRLPFLDIVSFNVYPLWPREVVVRGYEPYLRDVLKPLADGRPLWITEFGLNTLESTPARQAEILPECWAAIARQTGGGVVFSFADEWWKNYDNPVAGGDFWQRSAAADDEKTHDLDPEEYYGIVDEARRPKPAFEAVAAMYGERRSLARASIFLAPLVLLMSWTVYLFTSRS